MLWRHQNVGNTNQVLPSRSQSVLITNSGWKAVAINPSTPVNFPGSMTVGSLMIRGAWDILSAKDGELLPTEGETFRLASTPLQKLMEYAVRFQAGRSRR